VLTLREFSRKITLSVSFIQLRGGYGTVKTATQPRMLSLTPKILNLVLTLTVSLTG